MSESGLEFRPDDGAAIALAEKAEPGRAWVRGQIEKNKLKVTDFEPLNKDRAPRSAEGKTFSAALGDVGISCNHQPGPEKEMRRQMRPRATIPVTLANNTDQDVAVTLARAWLSLHQDSEGLLDEGGSQLRLGEGPTGVKVFTLKAREKKQIELLSGYPEHHHGKNGEMWATVLFTAGKERLFVRGSGSIKTAF